MVIYRCKLIKFTQIKKQLMIYSLVLVKKVSWLPPWELFLFTFFFFIIYFITYNNDTFFHLKSQSKF